MGTSGESQAKNTSLLSFPEPWPSWYLYLCKEAFVVFHICGSGKKREIQFETFLQKPGGRPYTIVHGEKRESETCCSLELYRLDRKPRLGPKISGCKMVLASAKSYRKHQ